MSKSETPTEQNSYQLNVYLVGIRDADDETAFRREAVIAHDEDDAKLQAKQDAPSFYSRPRTYHIELLAEDI